MSHAVAIVGAGPSGFYAADGLLRARPGLRIDLIDRLPTPLGLVRAGVAPDHQGTKAVSRQFDRLLDQPGVRFAGNIEVGRDISWDALRAGYDAVVVATGMTIDRKLGVPGEGLPHVVGSWRFMAWVNSHPDFARPPVDLSRVRRVAVIGNGNVALDVARVLAKSADEMAKSDIAPEAAAAIAAAPLTDIHVIGRRGPEQASFTNNELAEMGRLARTVALTDAAALHEAPPASDPTPEKLRKNKNLEILRGFTGNEASSKPIAMHFVFHAAPLSFEAGAVELTIGRLDIDLAITCIGYSGAGMPSGADVFAVGWARRGPSGTIPTNRGHSHGVAQEVAAFLDAHPPKDAPDPLAGFAAIDAEGWRRIDKAESEAGAGEGRPRVKISSWERLLALARNS